MFAGIRFQKETCSSTVCSARACLRGVLLSRWFRLQGSQNLCRELIVRQQRVYLLQNLNGRVGLIGSEVVVSQDEAVVCRLGILFRMCFKGAELARRTGRTKSYYAREMIETHLAEVERRYLAEAQL